jgi:hypothetical protein
MDQQANQQNIQPNNQQNYQQGYAPPPPQQPYYRVDTSPLTIGQYMVMFLLMAIPLVNIIMLFVWAFGDNNMNKKNFGKAALIWGIICTVLSIIFFVFVYASLRTAFNNFDFYNSF